MSLNKSHTIVVDILHTWSWIIVLNLKFNSRSLDGDSVGNISRQQRQLHSKPLVYFPLKHSIVIDYDEFFEDC